MRTMTRVCGLLVLLAAMTATAGEAPADALSALPAHIAVDSRLHASAQPTAQMIANLPAAGVRTVINLRPAGPCLIAVETRQLYCRRDGL